MKLGTVYAPFSAEHVANPYPFYAKARAEEPVFFSEELGFWVVSRYADVAAVLKDHRRFRVGDLTPTRAAWSEAVEELLGDTLMVPSLVMIDPPDHTPVRAKVTKAFSARRINGLEPLVRMFANQLIDALPDHGTGDFVELFAHPFPMKMIGHLLNLPESDEHRVQQWSDGIMQMSLGDVAPQDELKYARSAHEFREHCYAMLARAKRTPGDDLVHALIDSDLTDDQIAGLLQLLLLAGFETTVLLLANGIRELLADRVHWETIAAEPALIPRYVEEIFRFESPVVSLFRFAAEDVEIGGRVIPKGASVQVLVGSANRDDAVFRDPEVFDPAREKEAAHLSLGMGVHFCLGAALARMEAKVALEELTRRVPSLKLADQELEYRTNLNARGPIAVRVEW